MTADADLPCPLCQSAAGDEIVTSLTGADLRALWHELNRDFSEQSWGNIGENYEVHLFHCGQCGFQFFDPNLAGNGSFYEELQHENYYTPDRPEFTLALKFARKHGLRRILDVGCGTGRFLDLAKEAGMETFGLELNQNAIAEARSKNHTIWHSSIEEFVTAETNSALDLIRFFRCLSMCLRRSTSCA